MMVSGIRYKRREEMGIDAKTYALSKKYTDNSLAGGGSSTVSLATEEEARNMAENLFREAGGTIDDNARVAEETEVEEAIGALDDI